MGDGGRLPDDAIETAVAAVRSGDQNALAAVLAAHPALLAGPLPGHGGRSLLHVATDWPGHLPHIGATIAALVAAGADVGARFVGEHSETPLHWAASNDDTEAVVALLEAGADIDARGAVIGGGTPLNDATAFAQWDAARLLVERGATVSPFDAAALGMSDRVAAALASGHVESLDPLLWGACHGGHLETASVLVDAGADVSWRGWDALTPLGVAERAGATELVQWLRDLGARS
ncbi:MAG: ankyrin repeat domain-containing protein [Ornithinibacter sp.]